MRFSNVSARRTKLDARVRERAAALERRVVAHAEQLEGRCRTPTLLPYVMLVDVVEPLDFRYRLIGTAARSIMRRDYTGLLFSQIPGKGQSSVLWQGCESVARGKLPLSLSPPYVGTESLKECENVLLPLSDNRVNVTMILKVISFERG